MAKGKHSAALFEVINNSKRPERVAQSLRTPKWWFKGSQTPSTTTEVDASASMPESDFATSAPAVAIDEPRMSATRQNVSRYSASRSSAVHVDFDRDKQEITFRLRYTTAIVSAFAICAVVGMAYVIGRHISRGPQVASAADVPAAQAVLQQPSQHGVTEVPRTRSTHTTETPQPARRESGNTAPVRSTATSTSSLIPAGAETGMPRAIGLNYAIIQTYPPDETKTAEAARDFLTQHGIPCTLERTDFVRNENWICLVGTAGFAKISNGDFKTYADNIIKLGEKFPSSKFDRFKPAPYKWKG